MPENNGIAGADPAKTLICIDLEPVGVQHLYLVILILEIDGAVIVLEGPHKGQAVGIGDPAFNGAFRQGPRAIGPENDHIVPFTARNARIQGVENPILVGIKTRFFVFPGGMGKQFEIMTQRMVPVAGAEGEAHRQYE